MKAALVLAAKWSLATPPLALPLLAAHLRRRGHEVVLFDMNGEVPSLARSHSEGTIAHDSAWDDEELFESRLLPERGAYFDAYADRIVASGAALVGFSLYYSNTLLSFHLAGLIKSRDPRIKIVFGGPNCLDFERCLSFIKADCVDAVVIGEGDRPLPAIADSLERTGRIAAMKGVLLSGRPETWNSEQDTVDDLATLPFADYDRFDLTPYGNVKTIHSARGCVRKCNFCSEWGGRPYRQIPGKRVCEEIVHQLQRHPAATEFMFGDSLINGVMKSLNEFCDLMIQARVRSAWWGFAIVRPEMTERVFARMREAGCRSLMYGVESGSQSVLDAMEKHATVELAARVLRDCTRGGIPTTAPMIAGYPSETEADFDASIEFVKRNAENIRSLSVTLFSVFELKKEPGRFNLPPSPHDRFWQTKDGGNTFPMRVSRAKRMISAARSAGIPFISLEGAGDPAELPRLCDELLEQYADWKRTSGRAGTR